MGWIKFGLAALSEKKLGFAADHLLPLTGSQDHR
jgi:hypothetical protein